MARIDNGEYNRAQAGNIEKINGDYFLKVLLGDSDGDFISDSSPLPTTKVHLRKEVDTTNGAVIYTGYAPLTSATSAAVWQIKRITITGALISEEWADGDTSFNNIWTNRAALSYS